MGLRRLIPVLLIATVLNACTTAGVAPPPIEPGTIGVMSLPGRDFRLVVPTDYDPQRPTGLVIGLHGYTANSADLDSYFGLSAEAGRRGLLVALPEGTEDPRGDRFWNATSACCDFYRSGVDDSTYLVGVIDQVKQAFAVDPRRVFIVGHSNGGFMAHRMGCEHADVVTGIMSLAGPQNLDREACRPSHPVSVLHVHGTADATIDFSGTDEYPSAEDTAQQWAGLNECTADGQDGDPRDLDTELTGAETEVTAWPGCPDAAVELWAIEDGLHTPALAPDFAAQVLDWLEAHARSAGR